ncbi:DUF2326 domain-containing protein [Luteibacter sp. CQ10]|uniref:DUF2326 domain-containing protein n=1 Tax=Luteibacter sp. CQ10 TaxID=2805821 RepID=UPI0034A58C09
MLAEVFCDRFRRGAVRFGEGLNVVLGDENATNSIGKSTLLMIIDFAFGGMSLLLHNKDVVSELGDHDYFITFTFDGTDYHFRRGTYENAVVHICTSTRESTGSFLSLVEYTSWLNSQYSIRGGQTFRSLVNLYFRIWGKENLDVHKPLHAFRAESGAECVDNLLKAFDRYAGIRDAHERLRAKDTEKKALRTAMNAKLVPKIGKRDYNKNIDAIDKAKNELSEIRDNLARFATNIAEIVNRKVVELKSSKDLLLPLKLKLEGKLSRIRQNLDGNRFIRSKNFDGVRAYFPNVNEERLAQVETFHSEISRLLRAQLKEAEASTERSLAEVSAELKLIDSKISDALVSVDQPTVIVDRVFELATALTKATEENSAFELAVQLASGVKDLKKTLEEAKLAATQIVQSAINDGLRRAMTSVYGEERKSPHLSLTDRGYSYEVYEDSGTGTAYAALVALDLTVLKVSQLPTLSHDSVLFKNIENGAVARLISEYPLSGKQTFIAIDEISKYGPAAASILKDRAVVFLTNEAVLFDRDWRVQR